jgi:hypothetical protein
VKKPKDSAEEVTLGVRSPPRCASRPPQGCGGCSRSPTRSPPPCRPACSPVCAVQRRRRPRHRRRDERNAQRGRVHGSAPTSSGGAAAVFCKPPGAEHQPLAQRQRSGSACRPAKTPGSSALRTDVHRARRDACSAGALFKMKTPLSSGLAGRAKGLWAPGRILEGAWSWWGELWTTLAGLAPPEFRICAVEYSVVRSKCRALFKMKTPLSSGLAGRAKGLWAPGRIPEGAWS